MISERTPEPEHDDGSLPGKVERFEDHHAVIVTFDRQTLLVAKEHLPPETKEGDEVWITVQTKALREEHQKKMAKALLNEILNPEP